jgi:hypothetical protein
LAIECIGLTQSIERAIVYLAKGEKKPYGRFDLKRKYPVLGIYGSDAYTDFLLADEDGIFRI